jgi:hypothetical protein
VKKRVAEILDHLAWGLGTGAGMVAARGLVIEAVRLKQMLPREEETDRNRWRGLSEAQWTFLSGPNAAQNAMLIESSTVNRGP